MNDFLTSWAKAASTSIGFFWMALWAFVLGYLISSMIQVFVTESRMQKTMGSGESKGVLLGSFFGFISSSCSFSALATSKTLFQKGASFIASLAFMLASTNLVIELGIVISIFLGWQFIVGEYIGGILLILCCWLLVSIINPKQLLHNARKNLGEPEQEAPTNQPLKQAVFDGKNWSKVGQQYVMEWKMVWKDVTIGFTIAGIVAAYVPDSFFHSLFIETGSGKTDFSFFVLLEHVLVGPIAAFLTFIGSMGNIPLAALLFGKGVSFAGVMAFIFSDLVVFPVLRINANYYGWKMSLFILFLLFASLLASALLLHYGFSLFDALPTSSEVSITQRDAFKIDYTFFLNLLFVLVSAVLVYFGFFKNKSVHHHKEMAPKSAITEKVLSYLSGFCFLWLVGGLGIWLFY